LAWFLSIFWDAFDLEDSTSGFIQLHQLSSHGSLPKAHYLHPWCR
jgi:hypothetical protein